jgi:tRNA (mo5U34)-methyltransferase
VQPAERIAAHDWWHTIELAPDLVTPGGWDLRPTAAQLPWPEVAGARCLDVGTMDGFWAFELERRGAREVVATDIGPAYTDVPARRRAQGPTVPRGKQRFALAAELLGSRASYVERNVYDLDPQEDGEFDVVVMGYVLQMVRDPLRALAAVRSVCRGSLLLLDTVSLPLSLLPAPLARLDARRGALEWFVFNRRGLIQAVDHAGFEVEQATGILRDRPRPAAADTWRHRLGLLGRYRLGLLGRSCAVRARPANV